MDDSDTENTAQLNTQPFVPSDKEKDEWNEIHP